MKHKFTDEHGKATAAKRYGSLNAPAIKADDCCQAPQFPEDQHAPGYNNDVPESSWLRGGGKGGEGKPSFDKGKR